MAEELFSRWLSAFTSASSDPSSLRVRTDQFNALYKKATSEEQGDFHHLASAFTRGNAG